jgi:hypothetical protein
VGAASTKWRCRRGFLPYETAGHSPPSEMDMSPPLTGNDYLILTPSVSRDLETIRETQPNRVLPQTLSTHLSRGTLAAAESRRTLALRAAHQRSPRTMDRTRDGNAPLVAVSEAVDAARAAAVAAAEARCAAVVAEKEAVAAVEFATIAADKVGLAVEAVNYQSFVQDNSMVTDFLSPLLSLPLPHVESECGIGSGLYRKC